MTQTNQFALIGHPPTIHSLHKYVEFFKPEYREKPMNDNLLKTMFNWTPSFQAFDISAPHPHRIEEVKGVFVLSTFFPEMLYESKQKVLTKIEDAIRVCEEAGAKVAALGGFTSIADGQQGQIVSAAANTMAVTNGSTMTTALTIAGIEKGCSLLNLELSDAHVAVIGATGSIGRTCAQYFMDKAGQLTLTGRKLEKLNHFFPSTLLSKQGNLSLTTDNQTAVAEADIVICVTSATRSIFTADCFKSGALVCDVGFPKTVSDACSKRSDIIVFLGGLAKMPWIIDEATVWGLHSKEIVYGCFAEAIVVAMEKCYELCTVGLQDIDLESVLKMKALAFKHGFEVAPFFNAGKQYTHADFEHIKTVRAHHQNNRNTQILPQNAGVCHA